MNKLIKFNSEHCLFFKQTPVCDHSKFCYYAFSETNWAGGISGWLSDSWCYVDLLFVEEKFRGSNIGSKLIQAAEDFALSHHCFGIRLETWDFQAKGFYEKQGFSVFGELKDCPPGTTMYFLKKLL